MAGKNPTEIKALHELEKRLTCAVCLELFAEPKFLPCFHVFCKECLRNLDNVPREDGNFLSCPVCRSQFRLPEGGVFGFPTAFHLNDLLELRQQLKKLSEAENIACENCDQHDATGFCRQCGKFLCQKCAEAHSVLSKLFPDHEIVGLKEVISTVSQLIPVKQQAIMECPTHKKPLDIYCETCGVLVCQHCTIRQHRDHECDPITDVYQKHLQQITKRIPPAKEKLTVVREAVQALVTRSEEVVSSKERVRKEVEDRGRQLVAQYTAAVQECVQYLTHELEQGAKEQLEVLSTRTEEAKSTETALERCVEYAEQQVRIGSKQQILANELQMVRQMDMVTSQVKMASLIPLEEVGFEFNADKQAAEMPGTIGTVCKFSALARRCTVMGRGVTVAVVNQPTSFQLTVRALSTGVLPSFPVSLISCQVTPSTGSHPSDCDVKETDRGVYKVTYTPTSRGRRQLRVSVGGVEIPGSPFAVSVTLSPAMRGTPVRTVAGLNWPCFVAPIGDDKLVVTECSRHCVTVLDKHGKKIMSFGSQGSANGQFHHPTGVTVTTDDRILVVDRNNHRIQKFAMDGSFIAAVGSKGTGKLNFTCPQNIVVHPSGKVLVADCYNNRIQVLNPDLSFSHSFGSFGSGPAQFASPYDMAIDDKGMVYVAGFNNHCVQKFTLQGEFVARFKGEVNTPTGIAIDQNNVLYVSNDHFVSMFDTNGKFLRKFGKYGSGDAEFNSPIGVLVDKSGDLFVCDNCNNRLVVY